MEPQKYALTMQREMIAEIEAARPRFVIFTTVPTSWLAKPDSHHLIFEWFETYLRTDLRLVGLVDIQPTRTDYQWGEKAVAAIPKSRFVVWIYERNESP
jgi:hypothetical protein